MSIIFGILSLLFHNLWDFCIVLIAKMFWTDVLDEALVNYECKLVFRVHLNAGNNWVFGKQAEMFLLNEVSALHF